MKRKKAKLSFKENFEYVLRDKNGKVKPLFQPNKLMISLMKRGILSPNTWKIPVLLGTWRSSLKMSNLITNAGMAGVASRINGDGSEAIFNYIAIGTGTTAAAATDTALETEITTGGGARAAATVSRTTTDVTNDTARAVHTFNFTSSFAVTEAGVLNAASSGVLLNRQVFSAVNVVNGDSLQVTVDVDVD